MLPTTVSVPGGRTMVAVRSDTTRREPPGATLPTMSSTLKYWLRNPMSPGITTTPGIGGTTKFWPLSSGTRSAKPVTLRFGIAAWIFSVSGMIVDRSRSTGSSIISRSNDGGFTSLAPASVGSTTGKSIRMSLPGVIANAALKLNAWKFDASKTMPLARISSAVSGRAVICVMSSFSITVIVAVSGDPYSTTSPLLTSRMCSTV